jgi:hypothetical protein
MTTVTKPLTGIRNPEKKIMRPLGPKDLVPRLGASEAMIRMFLRKYYPDIHVKNKSWIFTLEQAGQIEADYKNRVQARDAEKKRRIAQELAGIDE